MISRLLFALTLITSATFAYAEAEAGNTLASRQAMAEQTREFMDNLAEGQTGNAYKSIRPYLGVPAATFDNSADEAVDYLLKAIDKAGHTIGISKVQTRSIGDDFHQITWLQKFQAAALVWTFTFYQPDTGWHLVGVDFSTDIGDLYQLDN